MAAEAPKTGPTTDALPKQFGPYRVARRLGRGGMGVVYLAEDSRLSRQVAIKVCNVSAADGPGLERFRREATSAAGLRHPNLCPVYEFDVRDGVPYLAMAFIDGPTLAEWMAERVPLEPKIAARIIAKLAAGMRAAHAQGVIHRDLKPGNVLLDKGEPVIVDFGLARPAGAEANLTKKGAVVGTPSYMSPEQIRADDSIGPACDIYALGVILYELLTGRRPFEGPPGVVLAQILYTPTPPLHTHRPGLDPKLEAICLKAMAKAPAARFSSMTELAKALEPFARSQQSSASAPRRTPKKPERSDTDATQPPTQPTPRTPAAPTSPAPAVWPYVLLLLVCLAALGAAVSFPWWKQHLPGSPAGKVSAAKPADMEQDFVNSVDMKLIFLKPGPFEMGTPLSDTDRFPDEGPHLVTIAAPFYLGATEVTQRQYERIMGTNPSHFTAARGGGPEHPVESLTWDEAVEFCKRLSALPEEKKAGRVYRLPTEEEWEYACRAGTTGPFNFAGRALADHAWFSENAGNGTHHVGSRPANGWGLLDMHGNVGEWCADWYRPTYGVEWPDEVRVVRGGSWSQGARACRSAFRSTGKPSERSTTIGFRVAMTISTAERRP